MCTILPVNNFFHFLPHGGARYLEFSSRPVMNRGRPRVLIGCLGVLCVLSFVLYGGRVHYYYTRGITKYIVPVGGTAEQPLRGKLSRCVDRTSDVLGPPGGFVVSFRYWEQQTQGVKSLLQLQCLATRMKMRVVEPFLYRSFLGFPVESLTGVDYMHLSDLIDVSLWNKQSTSKFKLYPLARWPEFIQQSPRDVVVLCIKYRNPHFKTSNKPNWDYTKGCPNACYGRFNKSVAALAKYGQFRIVQRRCVNFVDFTGTVTESTFIEDILAGYQHRNVTVFINEFRGFMGLYRAQIVTSCGVDFYKPNFTVLPSEKVMSDARRYVADVLDDEPFVAVLVRIERVVLHLKHNFTECGSLLKSLLWKLSHEYGARRYFVAMDIGKFGSSGAIKHNLTAARHGRIVLDATYGGNVSYTDWESTFERYTSRAEGAYVANLQRAIASKARCLVMFGAGGFQGQARNFYEKEHTNPADRCIHKICHEHRGSAPLHVSLS